ncbi:MAG TPA: hypothetical protein VM657_15525 [Sphingomonas sp.]|nr:hypothetical protein [Sphingomonas sp.]
MSVGIVPPIAAFATLALTAQLVAYPNHDVAWVLWGARAMLDGAQWGRDIIEPNPPLAWYLAMPSIWLGGLLHVPVVPAFEIVLTLTAVAALIAFHRLTVPVMSDRAFARHAPMLVAGLFLLIFPHRDFGQREHIATLASLPYLALVSARLNGRQRMPLAGAVSIGIAAGLGFALKPYFLAVPLLVEATALTKSRQWRSAFRPETFSIAAVVVLYAASLLVFDRTYLVAVVPLAQSIYWSFDAPFATWGWQLGLPAVALLIAFANARKTPLAAVFVAAGLGFTVSALVQAKGYSYHLFPVTATAAIALSAAIAAPSPRGVAIGRVVLALLLLLGGLRSWGWWEGNRPGGQRAVAIERIVATIDRYAAGESFLVVAVHPFPSFPAALYANSRQVSRTNSQWFLPAVAQGRSGLAPAHGRDVRAAEREARRFILHDLGQRPRLVIIDTDSRRHTRSPADFDFLAFYEEDARFRASWSAYREIAPLGQYRLFVRSGSQQ